MKKQMFVHFVGVHAIQKGGSTLFFTKLWEVINDACPLDAVLSRATFNSEDDCDKKLEEKADVVVLHMTGDVATDQKTIFPIWKKVALMNKAVLVVFQDSESHESANAVERFRKEVVIGAGLELTTFAYSSLDELEAFLEPFLSMLQKKMQTSDVTGVCME